jgi:hypothetical protein
MKCLDARRLLHQGDAASEPQRDAALDHLDGCADCAAIASDLDPLLLFRRLPGLSISGAETARMRDAVSVLRRAPADPPPPRAAGVMLRLAAAIVAAGGLWLAPGPLHREARTGVGEAGGAGEVLAEGGSAVPAAELAGAVPLPEYLPSVETIGGTEAYVATQVTEHDLTLVILANVDVAGR